MKLIIKLLLGCSAGFLHWLFGNLYETIVFSPNLILATDRIAVLTNIRALFKISAPYYYYLPWSPLSILLTIYLWFVIRRTHVVQARRWINYSVGSAISAGLLTWYIIVAFNLTLWVGSA